LGNPFVFLADEFYLLGRTSLPAYEHYGDFWQIENGVGMVRMMLSDFKTALNGFPKYLKSPLKLELITGLLAGPVLEKSVIPKLNQIGNLNIRLLKVRNRFYGDSVTVSGLLTGQDILQSAKDTGDRDRILLLPCNCLNTDGLFLDDMTISEFSERAQRDVQVINRFDEIPELA
jgi:NifB/MoaA-like Fe-S oxidoreductase